MDGYYRTGASREDWVMSTTPTVIDYNHQHSQPIRNTPMNQPPVPVQPPEFSNLNDLVQLQLQMLNKKHFPPPLNTYNMPSSKPQFTSFGHPNVGQDSSVSDVYNPFIEDIKDAPMEISDDEKESESVSTENKATSGNTFTELSMPIKNSLEVKSGAAFYQGLILYIPPFEQLAHTYRGSPALKMLYASFDFSFKMPVKIDAKPRENEPNMSDATVCFRDNIIATGSGWVPHVEASVRALEILSETCYTIQAKEDYFINCKLVDADNMKTLNLKKWEAVSEKYPKIVEVTKESHIQKTIAVFLDSHTSTGIYEDIVCCNLSREDVNKIKRVVEFFHLTMLPCSISTKLSKKETPCVVSIHKYTSAKKLLDILVECGGENNNFILHPPDTFKDFYKLHPNYWDPNLRNKPGNNIEEIKSTLEDPSLQALIMKPYENIISELFKKHKSLPKEEKSNDDTGLKKASDDFMKSTFQIDMAQSKNKAPVERMQLLLKYMEQLQEYGSRVLTSGRADMIKIYHNAIDNVRKDLDNCRKDIEKEQENKGKAVVGKTKETSSHSTRSRSPVTKRRSPQRRRSKSPVKRSYGNPRRSASPRRSKSPVKRSYGNPRRSASPRRRPRSKSPKHGPRSKSPRRRSRSKSPRRRSRSKSPRRQDRIRRSPSPRRRPRSPRRARSKSPRRAHRGSPSRRRSPSPKSSKADEAIITIFKDQFRRYMDILRRFRIEIEDTPIEWRGKLRDRLFKLRDQLSKFNQQLVENPVDLREFEYELEICAEELSKQNDLISLPPAISPMSLSTGHRLDPQPRLPINYPQLNHRPVYGFAPPPPSLYPTDSLQPPPTPSRFNY